MKSRDDEIRTDAIAQLKWDSRVNADDVKVSVLGGVVVLEGTVPTYWAKLAAEEDCELVGGVRRVDNMLEVRWSIDKEPPESEIGAEVEHALQANANVDTSRVTVSSSGGEVSLKGSVDSLWRKRLIEHIASDVIGVRRVDNQLTIVPSLVVEDEVVASHIRDAIRRNMMVEADEIDVHVASGIASLTGRVKSRAAQRAAHDIAIHTSGVVDLNDNLVVVV